MSRIDLRWQTLVDHLPPLIWCADAGGKWTWASQQWTARTGQPLGASLGDGWLDMVHPDDRAAAIIAWIGTRTSRTFNVAFRIFDRHANDYRWHSTRATPVWDDGGTHILEWIGASSDIDALLTAQATQRQLIEALDHRIRETHAAFRSLVRQAAEQADSAEEMAMLLSGRIDALARAQLLATIGQTPQLDLTTLIADELTAFGLTDARCVQLLAEPIAVPLRTGERIALVIHELLSQYVERHRLHEHADFVIQWHRVPATDPPMLTVTWRETGIAEGTLQQAASRSAHDLLRHVLPHDLHAHTHIVVTPPLLIVEIRLALG